MDAIAEIEQTLGAQLPRDYVSFLFTHRAVEEAGMYLASNPDYWGLRMLFDTNDEPLHSNVAEVLRLVQDVIPPGTLPIAEDWSGNMYLLVCKGTNQGHVVWWSHERELGDISVDRVANSFSQFKALIRREAP